MVRLVLPELLLAERIFLVSSLDVKWQAKEGCSYGERLMPSKRLGMSSPPLTETAGPAKWERFPS